MNGRGELATRVEPAIAAPCGFMPPPLPCARAERGDFSEVQRVLERLRDPYSQPEDEPLQMPPVRAVVRLWDCVRPPLRAALS